MMAAGFTPKIAYPGVDVPWPSVCASCGREPSPSLSGVREGKGCMYCAQKNPSTPEEAIAAMRAGGFEPLTRYSGRSKEPWPSRCLECGRTSTPSLATTRKGHGCRFCAPYGIDPHAPAIVYVVRHPTLGAVKIGIAGTGIAYDRVADHQKHGWDPPSYVHPCDTGEHAAQIEREVKRSLRARFGERGYLTRDQMPHGGWTETYPEAGLSPEQLRDLVDAAAQSVSSARLPPRG
jgi:hypothetical protein